MTYFFYIFSDTDEYWHSTAIDHVKDKRTLVTTSGSIYKLHGKICKLDTLERGIKRQYFILLFDILFMNI